MSNVIHVKFDGARGRMSRTDRVAQANFLFNEANAIDAAVDLPTMVKAERLYRRAIELEPRFAMAYTNLGTLRHRRGAVYEAEELFRRAAEIDPRQPEAPYNIGYVLLERGRSLEAIPYFEQAIERDSTFADAYYNLAMAWKRLGQTQRARPYWKHYLVIEPKGEWAKIARGHLEYDHDLRKY